MSETRQKRRDRSKASGSDALELFLLQIELSIATRERDRAQWEQDPFERAFRASHHALAACPPRSVVGKAARLAAYDGRMRAGHAWHPYRSRLREANRWVKAIREEMDWYE